MSYKESVKTDHGQVYLEANFKHLWAGWQILETAGFHLDNHTPGDGSQLYIYSHNSDEVDCIVEPRQAEAFLAFVQKWVDDLRANNKIR